MNTKPKASSNGTSHLQWLAKDLGCHLEFVEYGASHQRRLRLLSEGKVDVMSESSRRPEREVFAWFSLPYRYECVRFFALPERAASLAGLSMDSLPQQALMVVLPTAGWYGSEVEKLRTSRQGPLHSLPYDSVMLATLQLASGRADLMIASDADWEAIHKIDPRVIAFGSDIFSDPVSLIFSKSKVTPAEVEMFNAAIRLRYPSATLAQ